MKKKMLVLFLSFCMVLGCVCAAAAEPVTASVLNNSANNEITVKGTGSSGSSDSGSVTSPAVTPEMRDDKPTALFSDVTSEHWGFYAVNTLASEKIISGYGDGTFLPSNNITRAEFTKLIVGIEEKLKTRNENDDKQSENSDVSFSDVNENDWFAPFVASAAKSGFINGSDGSFRPNDNITREDAALIIYRMLTAIGKKPSGYKSFADRNDISDYAKDAVLALGSAKIVQGSGENMFLPKNNITRAEAAQLLYNVLNK